jgi:hypothetical protein
VAILAGKGSDKGGLFVYLFFLVHMLMFGLSGFLMAYSDDSPDISFLYMHGGFAILVYTIFYLVFFGVDQVRWMFINAALGLFGIYAQIDWILSLFGKSAGDFPVSVHVIPFLYYVLYTFLLYQLVLHLSGVHRHPERKTMVEVTYVLASLVIYSWLFFGHRAN